MGSHPINLALRFLLEMAALIATGIWGYKLTAGWPRYLWMILIPVAFAAIWGVFAVPDDPSRSGAAPVPTPGVVRLILELGFFAFAAWTLYDTGWPKLSLVQGIIVVLHYAVSYDRIMWLFSR